ncbi:ABC transporter permease subunit [Bradyrhizobium yuanmingense]|uniref:ABC transporter permease subunit n=1 Tax=Bradyrhizobium yuanmingense TaxID=108015 RepID=UPI003D2EDF52
MPVYWLALLLAVLVTLGIYAFMRSHHGLALSASRDNAAAARSVGVRTARTRHVLWIVVAFATGVVGAVVYCRRRVGYSRPSCSRSKVKTPSGLEGRASTSGWRSVRRASW